MSENMIVDFVEKKLAEPVTRRAAASTGERVLWKGIAAGIVGGLVATAAKTLAEKVYPPRTQGEPEPNEALAEKIAGHPLDPTTKMIAAETIHWGFGAAAGAAYGALAEYYPAATAREGANFGMTLMALTHEGVLPAMGVAADPADQSTREKASEMATHVVFGLVAEVVRGAVRGFL